MNLNPLYFRLIASLLFFFGIFGQNLGLSQSTRVEIVAKTTKIKVGKETIAVARQGEKFAFVKRQGGWIAIEIPGQEPIKQGWVLASAVRVEFDSAITDETPAPEEPADVKISVDLTQFPQMYGDQAAMYFKIRIVNESGEPIDFKVADLELKSDGQLLPRVDGDGNRFAGMPIFTDSSMRAQLQVNTLPYLKNATMAPGGVAEGWLAFSLASFQQLLFQPGALSGKSWILEGKVGPYEVRYDLGQAELDLISAELRPSKLDPTVQVIEIGSRINPINASRILDHIRSIPAEDRGCVLVLKNRECLFDGMATQQFQQQFYQFMNTGTAPVLSTEGRPAGDRAMGPYQGFFGYGQIPSFPSEIAATLEIIGRRADTGKVLIRYLNAAEAETRTSAARALTQHLVESGVVVALAKAVSDSEASVRTAAVTALAGQPAPAGQRENGSPDTVAVVKAMSDAEAEVRAAAARTAAVFTCDEVRLPLVKLLSDSQIPVKLAAANSSGVLRIQEAVPQLKVLQGEADSNVKTAAVVAQVQIGEITRLQGALAKLNGGILADADYAEIGRAKEKKAVEPLIARLTGNDFNQINWAARTLGDIGDLRAVDPLIQAFTFGNRNFGVAEVPRALGKLGDKKAIDPLRQSIKAGNGQGFPNDGRTAVFEALLLLKAPQALDDVTEELNSLVQRNWQFQAGPLLQAIGRTRDPKVVPLIEPFLADQQAGAFAVEALVTIATKQAIEMVEERLTAADNFNAQFIILNRQWPKTTASIALLKRIANGSNVNSRNAAIQALNNLQNAPDTIGLANRRAPVGFVAPEIKAEAWANGTAPKPNDLAGRVVVVVMPGTDGGTPEFPLVTQDLAQKFGGEDLVVLALWKSAHWTWDAAAKTLVQRPETTLAQEQSALADFSRTTDLKYRIGIVSANSGLVDAFAGPPGTRLALIDRAGILQSVTSTEDIGFESEEFELLVKELLAEAPPSTSIARLPRQFPKRNASDPAEIDELESRFDPSGSAWTIPAHDDVIRSVKFAPNGKSICTVGDEGVARVWETATGKLKFTLKGHAGIIRSCIFSADGGQIITSGNDQTIRVWSAMNGAAEYTMKDDSPCGQICALGDGRTLIAGSQDARPRIWNLSRREIEGYLTGHSEAALAVAVATVNGRSTVVSGSNDRSVKIWDFQSGEAVQTMTEHLLGVTAVAVSHNAKFAASGAGDGEVILWDPKTGEELHRFPGSGAAVNDMVFSSDAKRLAVARGNHRLDVYDVATGATQIQRRRGGSCVAFSKDGKLLSSGGEDGALHVWKLAVPGK